MTSNELQELKWQRPFRPFRVRTVNDEVFDILNPGLILVAKNGVQIGIADPKYPPPAVSDVIPMGIEDIVQVELIEPATA